VSWWRENALLDDSCEVSSEHVISTVVSNTLTLEKLQRSDLHARLTCQASNSNISIPLSTTVSLEMSCESNFLFSPSHILSFFFFVLSQGPLISPCQHLGKPKSFSFDTDDMRVGAEGIPSPKEWDESRSPPIHPPPLFRKCGWKMSSLGRRLLPCVCGQVLAPLGVPSDVGIVVCLEKARAELIQFIHGRKTLEVSLWDWGESVITITLWILCCDIPVRPSPRIDFGFQPKMDTSDLDGDVSTKGLSNRRELSCQFSIKNGLVFLASPTQPRLQCLEMFQHGHTPKFNPKFLSFKFKRYLNYFMARDPLAHVETLLLSPAKPFLIL